MIMGNFVLFWAVLLTLSNQVQAHSRKNVLFLVADDMRPELGCYLGDDFPARVHPFALHTPHLDALAARSAVLRRAYVQQALCSPSRASVLTGRRPDTTHVYDLYQYFRGVGGDYTTIPQYFKEQGYRSIGIGKIFHHNNASNFNDDAISWSEACYHPPPYEGVEEHCWDTKDKTWGIYEDYECHEDHNLPDYDIAEHAVKTLEELADRDEPFFLAVGFHKPHLPFIAPQEYFDLYPEDTIKLPSNPYAPDKMPNVAWSSYGEYRSYNDMEALDITGDFNSTLPDDKTLELRRAYYSAISFTDHLIGKVISQLDSLGLSDSTIISFWGDHGYHLGEHGEWGKHTNFELSLHAPMMIHVPGVTDHGRVIKELTEFVDLYPTLADAAGLEVPPLCPEGTETEVVFCREGESLMPLIKDPDTPWKDAAFSQRFVSDTLMGYSVRTDRYRYTEWVAFNMATYEPVWNENSGIELYDHKEDPDENYNIVYEPEYSTARAELSKILHDGWRCRLPPT